MKPVPYAALSAVVLTLDRFPLVRRVTQFVSPTLVVRATRQFKYNLRATRATFLVTYGAPNYRERLDIKLFKKACEPFPVRRLRFDHWPVKRAKKKT